MVDSKTLLKAIDAKRKRFQKKEKKFLGPQYLRVAEYIDRGALV